jgi:formylmethanofuran dehydrogenase subunit B
VDVLARGEADAALIVASDPVANLPRVAAERLTQIPTVALDTHESETTKVAKVVITTAPAGISAEGTVYRMDNVPLRLRKILPSPYPSDEELLGRIVERVTQVVRD